MEIFKKEIKFNNLTEIFVGFKLKLITVDKVISLIESNKVESFEAEDYSRLIKSKDLNDKFSKELEDIANKKIGLGNVNQNNNFTNEELSMTPDITRVWELECLLREINKYHSTIPDFKSKVLENVYELFYFFNFPDSWSLSKIILYSIDDDGKSLSQNDIYCNLLLFIDKEIMFFKKNKL